VLFIGHVPCLPCLTFLSRYGLAERDRGRRRTANPDHNPQTRLEKPRKRASVLTAYRQITLVRYISDGAREYAATATRILNICIYHAK